jgi:hypothetical protein
MSPQCFFQDGVKFLRRLALQKKPDNSSRLDVVKIARASPDMLPFSLCNKKRLAVRQMKRLLFPTTLSIPFYDIGK